jgi:hypothetical protein
MHGNRYCFTAGRESQAQRLFPTATHTHPHNNGRCSFFTAIKLVVVMSEVDLWKAQQPLLSQRPSAAFSRWLIVGNGENAALDPARSRGSRISSATPNRISASSPTPMHRSSHANARRRNAEQPPSTHQDPEDQGEGEIARSAERNVGKRRSYCKVSIKRVMVRFRSLSDRRISSILLMECSTVV